MSFTYRGILEILWATIAWQDNLVSCNCRIGFLKERKPANILLGTDVTNVWLGNFVSWYSHRSTRIPFATYLRYSQMTAAGTSWCVKPQHINDCVTNFQGSAITIHFPNSDCFLSLLDIWSQISITFCCFRIILQWNSFVNYLKHLARVVPSKLSRHSGQCIHLCPTDDNQNDFVICLETL